MDDKPQATPVPVDANPNPADPPPTPPPQTADPAPTEPQRVIRTFASDMAALGQTPQQPTPKAAPVAQPAPAPAPIGPAYSPNEAPRIVLPPKPTTSSGGGFFSGMFGKKDPGVNVTTLPMSTPSAWMSAPGETYAAPAAAQPAEEDREAVLARLRAKVAAQQEPVVVPPVFPSPAPEPAPPPPVPAPQGDERLRTYSGDFSTRVDTQQASAFSVLAAQADTQQAPAPVLVQKKTDYTLVYILLGTFLFVGGSLAVYFAYTYMQEEAPVPIFTDAPPSLISGEETFTISGSGAALIDALAQRANEPLTIGNVRVAFLATASTTGEVLEPGGRLIKAMELHAPDILLRNITDESTVGVMRAGEETRVFFVLGTNSYERTFAGMLSWEATIEDDLAAFYPAHPEVIPTVIATTTASTTVATSTPATSTPPMPVFVPGFVDAIVESHDVRILQDAQGRTVLMYGYRDQRTLIIARDETAFAVLLARVGAE